MKTGNENRDQYSCYRELQENELEGHDYRIRCRQGSSGIAIVAPHGGGIEPGTAEIADRVAGTEHTLYCFEGLKERGNYALHINSTNFDEPNGLSAVRNARLVVTIHGARGNEEQVHVGGLNRECRERIRRALVHAGFVVKENPRPHLGGRSPLNLCNRGTEGAGAQLEISHGLRQRMLESAGSKGPRDPSNLLARFVEAMRTALSAC